VVQKTSPAPSGDPHDYFHPAPYFWPNPKTDDGVPYIRRDGERVPGTRLYEPESDQYDRTRLQHLFDDTAALALSAWITGDQRFGDHGARLVRCWFLDPQTRMNPHLRFAQVRKGHNGEEGNGDGIIEMKDLYFFLDAVRLLVRGGALGKSEEAQFKEWLSEYLNWLLHSPQGVNEMRAPNNHGVLFDLQVVAIAAFLGDHKVLIESFRRSQDRVRQHFAPDGSQPRELARTNTAHYCAFNLQCWANLARLAEACGEDLGAYESSDGRGFRRALAWFLAESSGETWPHPQAESFDYLRREPLLVEHQRRFSGQLSADWGGDIESTIKARPVFFAHDGIAPFWLLSIEPSVFEAAGC
jgi:hypothetical protein